MSTHTIPRMLASCLVGFFGAAVVMFAYGVLLGSVWPQIYQAPWPSLGSDPVAAIARARVFDAAFGGLAGMLTAMVFRAAVNPPLVAPMACFLAGVLLHASLTGINSIKDLSGFLETPLPSFVAVFLAISFAAQRWHAIRAKSDA